MIRKVFFQKTKWQNRSGFALLEVMASMSLFAFIVFGYLRLANMYNMGIQNMEANNDVALTMARVTSTFGDDDRFCTSMFGGQILDPSIAAGVQIQKIEFHNLDGSLQGIPPILRLSDHVVNKDPGAFTQNLALSVQDIRLKPISPAVIEYAAAINNQVKTIVAALEVSFLKMNGGGTAVRKIPIYAILANSDNSIMKCSTSSSFFILHDQLCQAKSGGFSHVEYDSSGSPFCVDNPNIMEFSAPGTAGSVSCGPGYHVAIAENNMNNPDLLKIVCSAYSGATNVNPRTYNSPTGTIVNSGPTTVYIPHLDFATNTCTYDVDVTVPLSNYTYKIRCASN